MCTAATALAFFPHREEPLKVGRMSELLMVVAVTLKIAITATLLLCAPALALAYLLARREFFGKSLVETVVALPLVLPPTAVGFLLLRLFSVDGPLGSGALGFDFGLLLSWKGAVLASSVMALPLVVRSARVAFQGVNPRFEGISRSLGVGPLATFFRVSLPLAKRGVFASLILGFARALGEFGATVIVAGNIPGKTRTLALAIFSAEQAGNEQLAGRLMWVALLLGFAGVAGVEWLGRRSALGGGV
jgi:molybdate transport system permease protein